MTTTSEEIMLQINDTLVSLDLAEQFFICDISKCLGECCIEGDAGAPITEEEKTQLEQLVEVVWDDLLPAAQQKIKEEGVAYVDEEGDLVTQIVDGRNCVFTTYGPGGVCQCAIERAYHQGRCQMRKPMSCYLYPLRLTEYPTFTAVNYHSWKICKCACALGREKKVRLYEFMREPLIARFGKEWYDELALACQAYIEQYG